MNTNDKDIIPGREKPEALNNHLLSKVAELNYGQSDRYLDQSYTTSFNFIIADEQYSTTKSSISNIEKNMAISQETLDEAIAEFHNNHPNFTLITSAGANVSNSAVTGLMSMKYEDFMQQLKTTNSLNMSLGIVGKSNGLTQTAELKTELNFQHSVSSTEAHTTGQRQLDFYSVRDAQGSVITVNLQPKHSQPSVGDVTSARAEIEASILPLMNEYAKYTKQYYTYQQLQNNFDDMLELLKQNDGIVISGGIEYQAVDSEGKPNDNGPFIMSRNFDSNGPEDYDLNAYGVFNLNISNIKINMKQSDPLLSDLQERRHDIMAHNKSLGVKTDEAQKPDEIFTEENHYLHHDIYTDVESNIIRAQATYFISYSTSHALTEEYENLIHIKPEQINNYDKEVAESLKDIKDLILENTDPNNENIDDHLLEK